MTAVADAVRAAVAAVPDPELPVVSIADLGILRAVRVDGTRVEVDITPTYSGCPALESIRDDVVRAAYAGGATEVVVTTVNAPPWTTDWITERGRAALHAAGIAPPAPVAMRSLDLVGCPLCASPSTTETSRFGSTQCQSLRRCTSCREPFPHLRPH